MEDELYWVWLTSKRLMHSNKIISLFENFNSVEEIYREKHYFNIPNIGIRETETLKDKDLGRAKEIIEKIHKIGGYIITFDSEMYPKKLRNIINPPYILYCKGRYTDFDNILTIGIVGTRRITDYGRIVTTRFAFDLARHGVFVVSGMARGADTVAAKNALKAGGGTAAVLGCGLDVVYPPENDKLMDEIVERGVVITEYPPGTRPEGMNFPERNRIIAGLSNGILVTDAPKGSGSLITAKLAMENGRDVFAVPRSILDKNIGSNRIIQQGAKLVMNWNDIIEEYPYMSLVPSEDSQTEFSEKISEDGDDDIPEDDNILEDDNISEDDNTLNDNNVSEAESDEKISRLAGAEKDIAKMLVLKDMQIDEIAESLNLPVGTVNTKLIMLEVRGIVKKLPGGFYRINN